MFELHAVLATTATHDDNKPRYESESRAVTARQADANSMASATFNHVDDRDHPARPACKPPRATSAALVPGASARRTRSKSGIVATTINIISR